jgi:hypothetical protein
LDVQHDCGIAGAVFRDVVRYGAQSHALEVSDR